MSYAKLRADLLAARDVRETLLAQQRAASSDTLVLISTVIPGAVKTPPGSTALFAWGRERLHRHLAGYRELLADTDLLGPYSIFAIASDPYQVKQDCLRIEAEQPAARLLDIDVYAADGRQIGRREIGAPARPCLLCNEPAVDCIRLNRHSPERLHDHVADLLKPFAAAMSC